MFSLLLIIILGDLQNIAKSDNGRDATDGELFFKQLINGQKRKEKPGYLLFTAPYRLCEGGCKHPENDRMVFNFPIYIGKRANQEYKSKYLRDHEKMITKYPNAPFKPKSTTQSTTTTQMMNLNLKLDLVERVINITCPPTTTTTTTTTKTTTTESTTTTQTCPAIESLCKKRPKVKDITEIHTNETTELYMNETTEHHPTKINTNQTTVHQQANISTNGTTVHQQANISTNGTTVHQQANISTNGTTVHQQANISTNGTTVHQQANISTNGTTVHQQTEIHTNKPTLYPPENVSVMRNWLTRFSHLYVIKPKTKRFRTTMHFRRAMPPKPKKIQQKIARSRQKYNIIHRLHNNNISQKGRVPSRRQRQGMDVHHYRLSRRENTRNRRLLPYYVPTTFSTDIPNKDDQEAPATRQDVTSEENEIKISNTQLKQFNDTHSNELIRYEGNSQPVKLDYLASMETSDGLDFNHNNNNTAAIS